MLVHDGLSGQHNLQWYDLLYLPAYQSPCKAPASHHCLCIWDLASSLRPSSLSRVQELNPTLAYRTFVSMQTGNTIFIGLGASNNTQSTRPYGWLKSLSSLITFLLGCFFFSRLASYMGMSLFPHSQSLLVPVSLSSPFSFPSVAPLFPFLSSSPPLAIP